MLAVGLRNPKRELWYSAIECYGAIGEEKPKPVCRICIDDIERLMPE